MFRADDADALQERDIVELVMETFALTIGSRPCDTTIDVVLEAWHKCSVFFGTPLRLYSIQPSRLCTISWNGVSVPSLTISIPIATFTQRLRINDRLRVSKAGACIFTEDIHELSEELAGTPLAGEDVVQKSLVTVKVCRLYNEMASSALQSGGKRPLPRVCLRSM